MSDRLSDGAGLGTVMRTGYSLNTISLPSGNLDDIEELLAKKVDPFLEAYQNSAAVLDVSCVTRLCDLDFQKLQEQFAAHKLHLVGLSGVTTEDRALLLTQKGIPIINSNKFARIRQENLPPKIVTQILELKVPVEVKVPCEVKVPYEIKNPNPLKVISRPIRSGETISVPDNSVAIFGSVGDRARIIASHHVFIFGDLKGGELYAGNPKDSTDPGFTSAVICVKGKFDPALVAIAGNYQTAEDLQNEEVLQRYQSEVAITLQGSSLRYWGFKEFSMSNTFK